MNLPNKLTVLRIGLAMVMVVFVLADSLPFGKTLALIVFSVAGITDYWDGRLARERYGITAFGTLMDPLADKILICSAFVCFVAVDGIVPAWVPIVVIARDFLVTGLRLLAARAGTIMSAGTLGKQKTIWQIVCIVVILFGLAMRNDILPLVLAPDVLADVLATYIDPWFPVIAMVISSLVAVLTAVSGVVYLWRSRDLYVNDM